MSKIYKPWPEDIVRGMLTYINNDSRDIWLQAAMGIKAEFGDAGFEMWNKWSQQSSKYNQSAAKNTWKSVKSHGGVTIGTLVEMARSAGFEYNLDKYEFSEQDIAERQRIRDAERKRSQQKEREERKAAAEQADYTWSIAEECQPGGHPYLVSKGIQPHGARVGVFPRRKADDTWVQEQGVLLIPITNFAGEITSMQGIFGTMPAGFKTNKTYLRNGQKQGSFFRIEGDDSHFVFCEGFATGATIAEVTGYTVFVCFDRSNIMKVSAEYREINHSAKIIIAGDNDQWTDGNPGLRDARDAANRVKGRCVVPEFDCPPPAPGEKGPTDFNDLMMLSGAEAVRQAFTEEKRPEVKVNTNYFANEHFTFMGYNEGAYYYYPHDSKQITKISGDGHKKNSLLTVARMSFWREMFPKKDDVAWDIAADWMIDMSNQRGIFDPSLIRRRGAWLDRGRVVFHMGSYLIVDGERMELHDIDSNYIYPKWMDLPEPHETMLTDAEGIELFRTADMFRWKKNSSAVLMAGFAALAPICGVLSWRPHVWVTGGAGSGKTTVVNEYLDSMTRGFALNASGNSTEAGIRQALSGDAIPVIFDEAEQNNERESDRVQNIIALVRQSSSESGASVLKGTTNGKVISYTPRSMFCFSSIQVGIKGQADADRLTKLVLKNRAINEDENDNWKELQPRLAKMMCDDELPHRVIARMLNNIPTIRKNITTYRVVASKFFGDTRKGDQVGTLMAGWHALVSSKEATEAEAENNLQMLEWDDLSDSDDEDTSVNVLGEIMQLTEQIGSGFKANMYELTMRAAGRDINMPGVDQKEAQRQLGLCGMRYEDGALFIANKSQWVSSKLRTGQFATGWRDILARLPGVEVCNKAKRIGGTASKSVKIPLTVIEANEE